MAAGFGHCPSRATLLERCNGPCDWQAIEPRKAKSPAETEAKPET